jgi:hypothetical protein
MPANHSYCERDNGTDHCGEPRGDAKYREHHQKRDDGDECDESRQAQIVSWIERLMEHLDSPPIDS